MKINKTFIEDLLIIEPQLFKDDRGFFYESYNKNNLDKVINIVFVQVDLCNVYFQFPRCLLIRNVMNLSFLSTQ